MSIQQATAIKDALTLPLFDGGNMGVRRRQFHTLLQMPDYLTPVRP